MYPFVHQNLVNEKSLLKRLWKHFQKKNFIMRLEKQNIWSKINVGYGCSEVAEKIANEIDKYTPYDC